MILHLLRKDLRKTWSMDIAFVGFSLLLCAVVLRQDYVEVSGYGSTSGLTMAWLMLYMLVFGNLMNIEKYEEKHHAYRIMAQLPISSMDLALSKYLLMLINTVLGVLTLNGVFGAFKFGYRRVRSRIMALYIACLIGPQLYLFLRATSGAGSTLLESLANIRPVVIVLPAIGAVVVLSALALGASKAREHYVP